MLIEVQQSPGRGRGVFARTAIPKDTVIEVPAVLPLTQAEQADLAKTHLNDYLFAWDDPAAPELDQVVVLGLLAMANHSGDPNTILRSRYAERLMEWVTCRDIAAGEELTFRYRCELWFSPS